MGRRSLSSLIQTIENSSNSAPIEKQFIQDLCFTIERGADSSKRPPSKTFKPSSIGGCKRALYYQLTGAEIDSESGNSASGVGILENGTDRHERIQKAICSMQDAGIDCEYIDVESFIKSHGLDYIEVKEKCGMETKCFWEEIPLSFLTDGIIRYKGKYYILEIKTMNSQKFFDSRAVRDEHKAQGVCYSLAFKLDKVLYLYENRDSLAKKAFIFEVTDKMRDDLLAKVNQVKQAVSDGIPPRAEENHKCNWCSYKGQCKGLG